MDVLFCVFINLRRPWARAKIHPSWLQAQNEGLLLRRVQVLACTQPRAPTSAAPPHREQSLPYKILGKLIARKSNCFLRSENFTFLTNNVWTAELSRSDQHKGRLTDSKGQTWCFCPSAFKNFRRLVEFIGLQNWMTFIDRKKKNLFFLLLTNLYSHLWVNLHTISSQYKLVKFKVVSSYLKITHLMGKQSRTEISCLYIS